MSGHDAPPSASTTALRVKSEIVSPSFAARPASRQRFLARARKRAPKWKRTPGVAQPRRPRREQRGRFLPARKDAPARSDIRLDPQALDPRLQIRGAEFPQQIAPALRLRAVAFREILHRLAVRQIQSALARDEKFLPDGRLRIAQAHARTRRARDFRRAQTRRTAADDETCWQQRSDRSM